MRIFGWFRSKKKTKFFLVAAFLASMTKSIASASMPKDIEQNLVVAVIKAEKLTVEGKLDFTEALAIARMAKKAGLKVESEKLSLLAQYMANYEDRIRKSHIVYGRLTSKNPEMNSMSTAIFQLSDCFRLLRLAEKLVGQKSEWHRDDLKRHAEVIFRVNENIMADGSWPEENVKDVQELKDKIRQLKRMIAEL